MFLYFCPANSQHITRQQLPPALAHAFDADPKCAAVTSGPGKKSGLILAPKMPPRLGYYPDQQQWRPIPRSDCWVGIPAGADLLAADIPQQLERPDLLPGSKVLDSLGRKWHVPFAMNWLEGEAGIWWATHLPRRLTYTADGWTVANDVLPRCARLWELVINYLNAENAALLAAEEAAQDSGEREEGTVRFSFEAIDELAIEALALNYRLGPVEADLLGIYDLQFRRQIVDVTRGLPLLLALQKKRGRPGGDLLPPADASTPACPLPSPAANGSCTPPATTGSPT